MAEGEGFEPSVQVLARTAVWYEVSDGFMRSAVEFTLPTNCGRQGLLQIATHTSEDRAAAGELVHEALDRLRFTSRRTCAGLSPSLVRAR